MGSTYRKTVTRRIPRNAEQFKKSGCLHVRWIDRSGRKRTAPVRESASGELRVIDKSLTYTAKYRDASGVLHEVATGCRDKQAATTVLRDLETRAEKIRSGIVTAGEDRIARHQQTPISDHIATYMTKLESSDTSKDHRGNVLRCLNRIADYCRFATLAHMTQEAFEQYLAHRKKEDDSARTRNLDRASLVAFCNWCVETHRLASNPFEKITKANEETDRRHERRALAIDEIHRLLAATRERPLREALTIRTGKNKGQFGAKVRPEVRAKRIRLGNERALIYSALIYTGLRKGELASLTLAHLVLDPELAYLILKAKDEKGKRGAKLPLHPALAEAIQASLAEREAANGGPLPMDAPLFNVPPALSKIFNRDIILARIEKRDALGRVADVHCLRHTHASLLALVGVSPSVAQKSMRHSDVKLTMDVYTHLEMGEVAKAVSLLPDLSVEAEESPAPSLEETDPGTTVKTSVAPMVAPATVQDGQNVTTRDKTSREAGKKNADSSIDVKSFPDKRKGPLTTPVNGPFAVGDTGLEPVTPSLSSWFAETSEWQLSS
jgi:integrase